MSEACSHDCSSCGSDCAEREVPQNTRNDNNKNIDENLLDLPVYGEIWLYIICEAEEKYNFPLLSVIETIESRDFTLRILVEKLKIQQTALKLK